MLSYFVWQFIHNDIDKTNINNLEETVCQYAKEKFVQLVRPTFKEKYTSLDSEINGKWRDFLDSMIEYPDKDSSRVFPSLIRDCLLKGKNPELSKENILQPLENLKKLLLWYTFEFSEIIINAPNLTLAQSFCFFIVHDEYDTIIKELEDQKVISQPDEIYTLLSEGIRKDPDGKVFVGFEDVILDRKKNGVFKKLYDLGDIKDAESKNKILSEIQTILDKWIPPQKDNIFTMEIHEVYFFEQLIYLEVLELAKYKYFIRKCSNENCCNYFITNDRKRKYCGCCISKRSTYDKAYLKNRNPLKIIKDKKYQHISYLLGKNITNIEERQKRIKKWNKDANNLLKKYIQENRLDDEESFKKELEELSLLGKK